MAQYDRMLAAVPGQDGAGPGILRVGIPLELPAGLLPGVLAELSATYQQSWLGASRKRFGGGPGCAGRTSSCPRTRVPTAWCRLYRRNCLTEAGPSRSIAEESACRQTYSRKP
jgi:hypothetical protein